MATELIENPETPHTFVHDLESVFWVLIWVVVSYMRTSMTIEQRSNFLKDIMSPKVYGTRGGSEKRTFIQAREVPQVLGNMNMYFILSLLIQLLAVRYPVFIMAPPQNHDIDSIRGRLQGKNPDIKIVTDDDASNAGDKRQEDDDKKDDLKDHSMVIAIFEDFLNRDDWAEHDGANLQPKMASQDENRGMLAGSGKSRSAAEENGVFVPSS